MDEGERQKFWKEAQYHFSEFQKAMARFSAQCGVPFQVKEVNRKKIEENVAYLKARTAEIEARIVAATEDLFESQDDIECLHISIRVCCEFHKFLLDFGDNPTKAESEYVSETLRSGIDWFYRLAYHCHGIEDYLAEWKFDRNATSDFPSLRRACLGHFRVLTSDSPRTGGELLGSLLSFVHLALVFMAQTFPVEADDRFGSDRWQRYS